MCHIVYTNFQRQGAVANMTVREVREAKVSREYRVVLVWEHKTTMTHGGAKLAVHIKVYQLLLQFCEELVEADLVFTTLNGEKVLSIYFLDKLQFAAVATTAELLRRNTIHITILTTLM